MAIIYAIGGGNLLNKETFLIDQRIIKDSKKENPKLLYLGAANLDSEKNYLNFLKAYEDFKVEITPLKLTDEKLTEEAIENRFKAADIIYFDGGHTETLIKYALKFHLKEKLLALMNEEVVIAGISAGAIMLFEAGYGDYYAYLNHGEFRDYRFTTGLGIFKGIFCPHYQNKGALSFNDAIKETELAGYACEDQCALRITDKSFEVIKEKGRSVFYFDQNNHHLMIPLIVNHQYKL